MVFFDFERAEIIKPRPILGMTSPDCERKGIEHGGLDKKHQGSGFAEEINKAVHELWCLRVPPRNQRNYHNVADNYLVIRGWIVYYAIPQVFW